MFVFVEMYANHVLRVIHTATPRFFQGAGPEED